MAESNLRDTHEKLLKIRERKDLALKPTPLLRKTYTALDGTEQPLAVRYYQVQMIFHLLAMRRFVVGDDTGLGKCVTGDARVVTNRGIVPIREMQPGAMDDDTFRPVDGWNVVVGDREVPVRNFYYGGIKPTKRVTTRYGFSLEGSLIHPILTGGAVGHDWTRLRDIREGQYVCIERREGSFPTRNPSLPIPDPSSFAANTRIYDVPDRLTPCLARLLGYIVGEGWTANDEFFNVSQDRDVNPEVYEDIRTLLRECFGWTGGRRGPNKAENRGFNVAGKYLSGYLRGLGIARVLSAEKRVPPPVMRGTRQSVVAFLQGFFDGEASVTEGIEVSSASEVLLRDVQILLLRLGIVARRAPRKVKGRDHVYWRLTIFGDDASLFSQKVGFRSRRKLDSLRAVCGKKRNPNHDVVPHSRELFDVVREDLRMATARSGSNRHRAGSGLKQFGSSIVNTLNNIRNGGRSPSYRGIQQFLELLEIHAPRSNALWPLKDLLRTRYFYDPVVSIEDGEAEIMDIEVDDVSHAFIGNGFVNHNTLETIAALCYLWQIYPDKKAIILTKKSAVGQFAREFNKFTEVGDRVIVSRGTPAQRKKAYAQFMAEPSGCVLVSGYRSMVKDIAQVQDWEGFVLILDEVTVIKSPKTQVHQLCKLLSSNADRVWGLTATLIKNHLMEGYGIYQVVVPGLFRHTQSSFMKDYCIIRMQRVARGRQIPVIVGYRDRDIVRFRDKIDPYYLGRPKHEVASELPILTTKDISVGMTSFQHQLYQETLAGLLEMGDGEIKETDQLTKIIYCQEIANHPCLIGHEDSDSDKLDTLVDLLTDGGDFEDEKVIIFTRFRKMVDYAMPYIEKKGVKCVRVTGAENDDQRDEAMRQFQDHKSDIKVIWITMAGGDAINLQAAKAMIFYDTPWSAGDYLQILGRMIRIGSLHQRVYAIRLIADGTVDERVQEVLSKKMKLVEAILGKRIKGEDEGDVKFDVKSDTRAIFDGLREDALKGRKP